MGEAAIPSSSRPVRPPTARRRSSTASIRTTLLMEVAVTYSRPTTRKSSFFVYAAPVGEPALGPPAFMHRDRMAEIPSRPSATTGSTRPTSPTECVTAGWNEVGKAKIEASIFNGASPTKIGGTSIP